jgi:hypothetical protein
MLLVQVGGQLRLGGEGTVWSRVESLTSLPHGHFPAAVVS